MNGLSEEVLLNHFSKYGHINKIFLLPGKSCSFVEFVNVDSAISAFENIHGKLNITQNEKPLYLSYVKTLPKDINADSNFELPPGLIVLKEFINEHEEKTLLTRCDFNDLSSTGNLKFRQVKHYGYEFRYDTNNVDKSSPLLKGIPIECDFLWERLKKETCIDFVPDQLTINFYKPGHGIPSHVDTHSAFEDPIVSLSLGSSIVMEFKHADGRHFKVHLPKRSLLIMSKESRYDWSHGIVPRKYDIIGTPNGLTVSERSDRTSFTFRKIRKGECDCIFKTKCDSYIKNKNTIENTIANELENVHVYNVYENIASHFSETRHTPWPNVLQFVQSLEKGSILIDVGCGNGKYLGHIRDIYEVRTYLFDVNKNHV